MRYHAQRITTGEWLSRDLDLAEGVTTRALSTPGGVEASIPPGMTDRRAADGLPLLEKWATAIYAEDDGNIRAAGLVVDESFDGPEGTISAPGFTVYPQGINYGDSTLWGRVDPLVVVRDLWAHVQSYPDGDLGMAVDAAASPVRIGDNENPYRLRFWEPTDVGGEIDSLAQQTPFDYTEEHTWADATKSTVRHRLRIGYPRLGRRRNDLRFVEGENIADPVPVDSQGSQYANEVVGIGHGEGSKMVYVRAAVRDGHLRRPVTVTDKTANRERMQTRVRQNLNARRKVEDISAVTVVDHRNARIAAIDPGDDIYIDCELPYLGRVQMWVRVLAIAEAESGDVATLATQRSNAFTYSPEVE